MRRVLLALLLSLTAASAWAQEPEADAQTSPLQAGPLQGAAATGFRHFPGHRYIAGTALRVQQRKLSTSRILADIPRLHLVYAEPTDDPDWLAVRGAGAETYPQISATTSFVVANDGRLVLPGLEDTGRYVPLIGYVARAGLVDLDPPPDVAPKLPGLRPVPALWEGIGLPEPRFFAADPVAPPFDAIARLHSHIGTCTAFFVAPDVVVSAGHCIPPRRPYELNVLIERGADEAETIAATLVDARRRPEFAGGLGEDWAVVKLANPPRIAVTPLHFSHGDSLLRHASVRVTMVGYPADLTAVSARLLGYQAPVVSACTALLPEARADRVGDTLRSGFRLHAPCITFPGDSGGPLLTWSAARGRFEVIGITSTYHERDPITPVYSLGAAATVRRFATGIAERYGVPPPQEGFGFRVDMREDMPGAALFSALLPTFGAGEPWANFPLSTGLAAAVGVATGHVPKMPIAALLLPGVPIRRGDAPPPAAFGAAELAAARASCARRCDRRGLDPARQIAATIGMAFAGPAADLPVPDATGASPVGARDVLLRVAGGDLFAVAAATGTVGKVARDFMNLAEIGEDAAWDALFACVCDTPPAADATADASPEGLAGGVVMSARDLADRRRDRLADLVILSADRALLRLPGAVDGSFAAGTTLDGAGTARLAALLSRRTNGNTGRPVAVYGLDAGSDAAATLARRVLALGYRQVILLREGLVGWAASGLQLSRAGD